MKERRAAVVEERRSLSRGDDRLVRAVGRLPVKVRTKLLIAFVGTAVLLLAVGALGLRILAHSDDRVERLGPLQQRAAAYGKLQSDTTRVRLLLAENVDADFYLVWPGHEPTGSGRDAVDKALVNELERIGPSTHPDRLGFVPPAEDESVLREIRVTSGRLAALMSEIIDSPGDGQRPRAERLAVDLNQLATELANSTTAKTNDLIADNARGTRARGISSSAWRRARSAWPSCSGSCSPGR